MKLFPNRGEKLNLKIEFEACKLLLNTVLLQFSPDALGKIT